MTGGEMSPRPWRFDSGSWRDIIEDADGHAVCHGDLGPGICDRDGIVYAVNIMFPPPDAVQPPETMLALAVLRGDPSAAYALADELQAKCAAPDGFVSRREMAVAIRALLSEFGEVIPAARQNPVPPHLSSVADARNLLARLGG